jgi:hypothetical protein
LVNIWISFRVAAIVRGRRLGRAGEVAGFCRPDEREPAAPEGDGLDAAAGG